MLQTRCSRWDAPGAKRRGSRQPAEAHGEGGGGGDGAHGGRGCRTSPGGAARAPLTCTDPPLQLSRAAVPAREAGHLEGQTRGQALPPLPSLSFAHSQSEPRAFGKCGRDPALPCASERSDPAEHALWAGPSGAEAPPPRPSSSPGTSTGSGGCLRPAKGAPAGLAPSAPAIRLWAL